MPAPKQNPAVIAAAIATALRLAKAAKTAAEDIKERVGRAAKKPTIKINGK